jgi:hypothetical protein
MTDTQTEAQADTQTEAEANESVATVSLDSLDTFQRMFAERLIGEIEEHNKIVKEIKASSSNLDDVMDSVRAGDDPKVVKARERIESLNADLEKVEASLREYVKAQAEKILSTQKETDTSALDEQRKSLSQKISQGVNYLAGETGVDKKALPLPKVATLRGMSSGEGAGAGGRRLRGFSVVVDGKEALMGGKSSFSAAAKVLNTDTANLQEAYFKAAGTNEAEKFPAKVEFTFDGHAVVAYRTEGGAATERVANAS